MRMFFIIWTLSFGLCLSKPICDGSFRFASYYGDYMVLQSAPVSAVIWGHAGQTGHNVQLLADGIVYNTKTIIGPSGKPIWMVRLQSHESGYSPVTISATLGACTLTLKDVVFGDVWVCSGQSNMAYPLGGIHNPEEVLSEVHNHSFVRTFIVADQTSDEPIDDLIRVHKPWSIPNQEDTWSFSAVCWLFGVRLSNTLGIPIGLIESAWSGTIIEAWSSKATLDICFPEGKGIWRRGHDARNSPSVLYNAMIHPLHVMPIRGVIWYQGEYNVGNSGYYSCAMSELIEDWRKRWFVGSHRTMDEQFPFGQVQLAPDENMDFDHGFPEVRWAQTSGFGYTPNPRMEKVFTAVAMDLPDYDSPRGCIHPRFKRKIAERLAYGAFNVAYGLKTEGPYQGPIPSAAIPGKTTVTVVYEEGRANIEIRNNGNFDLCCADQVHGRCEEKRGTWTPTTISYYSRSSVTLVNPCKNYVTGVRYAWRVSPCPLEMCSVYRIENHLPAPPYIMDI